MAWQYCGEDAPLGRPREGPSWSWVYAADDTIEWPSLFPSDYYDFNGLCQSSTSLLLSAVLLPVLIQTWSTRSDVEIVCPLYRHCNVFEHMNSGTLSTLAGILRSGLLFPPLPGSISRNADAKIYHEALDTTFTILSGAFYADYRFWSSEEKLQHELQHVTFMAIGVEDNAMSDFREEHKCWVAGLALKLVGESNPQENNMPQYKRIGWLRYCTEKPSEEFVPAGTRTSFLLV